MACCFCPQMHTCMYITGLCCEMFFIIIIRTPLSKGYRETKNAWQIEREISFSVTKELLHQGHTYPPSIGQYLQGNRLVPSLAATWIEEKKLSPLFFIFYNSYELVVPSNTLASTLSPLPSRPATTTTYTHGFPTTRIRSIAEGDGVQRIFVLITS